MNALPRRLTTVLLAFGLACTAVACGTGGDTGAGGKVTISVNGQPPETQAFDRKVFDEDVAEFERTHPNIDIEPHEGFMDPKTFSAKLASGELEDVYYVYFTDPAQLIARRQAADITSFVEDLPHYGDLQQPLKDVFTDDGKVYGLPTANYSMGLLYNRELFAKAGLDPATPPSTWDEVAAAADKISDLGDDITGFAEYSKSNQGGWHFTAWQYSLGGRIATRDGDGWRADFDNATGREVVTRLHDMRWNDDSMGDKQLLELADVQQKMGAGQLGMYLAAADNVQTLVNQFHGSYSDYGLAPMPGGKATLLGGEGYMFNPRATPEKIEAGLAWLQWRYLNPDRFENNLERYKKQGQPVGLPVYPAADVWTGAVRERLERLKAKYATVPVENYGPYVEGSTKLQGVTEPPNAQQVYAALDTVMQGVLTDRDANVGQLLDDAESKVDSALAQVR